MPEFRVRLLSPSGDQWRETSMLAADADAARASAQKQADREAAFSLFNPAPVWRGFDPDRDALVNLADVHVRDYADHLPTMVDKAQAREVGEEALEALRSSGHEIDKTGKAHGPTARGRAHLSAHEAKQPYTVSTVEQVNVRAGLLIAQLKAIYEADHDNWPDVLAAMREQGIPTMAVTGVLNGLPALHQVDGSAVTIWSSATIQQSLHTSSWTPNQDTDDFFNDATNEVTGTGYTAGGVTVGSKTSTYDSATDQARLDGSDSAWPSSTIAAARRSSVWNNTAGASSTDPLLGSVDFGVDVSTAGGTLSITQDPTGILVYDFT